MKKVLRAIQAALSAPAESMIALLLMLLALSAQAGTTYQSFGHTNYIASTATITGFPTNSPVSGTNWLTGLPVSVANNEHVNFVFKSQPVGADATNSFTIKLLRGFTAGSPSILYDTNNGSWKPFPDWETLPSLTLVFNVNGTNATVWSTNLDFWVGGASHVGVYSTLNGFSAAVTNFDMGLSKKIVPIVYP